MAYFTNSLDNVKVASRCPANWDSMIGDDRKRFCGQCQLNVYNLSGMSRREAEALVMRAEGRLCVRFYRRMDGTILTENCPVGLRALKRRVSRVGKATISTVLGFLSGIGLNFAFANWATRPGPQYRTMGAIAVSVPPATHNPLMVTPVKGEPRRPLPIMGQMVIVRPATIKYRRSKNQP